ncbi:DUF7694 domain-containing protein [Shewanella violacea]|uniref:DUF7694 domain-containing protein n=1 Tax=Shewanella violacea (strain JCM 10179 / CIP 106290 / LMG 19151 / DSS12) TaxID=637905 RepID=D4ZJV0_SHEVD|nr:hypothetical protein [Shewanella violacea]BAJ01949.1 conserved hypothetical protein [Shewanella violacea DSS12]
MFNVPERYRLKVPKGQYLYSDATFGNNGVFSVPVNLAIGSKYGQGILRIQCSDGGGWDHVSVSLLRRVPRREEMCLIKKLFWSDSSCVVQCHSKNDEYQHNHEFCLHLWRCQTSEFPQHESILLGVKV